MPSCALLRSTAVRVRADVAFGEHEVSYADRLLSSLRHRQSVIRGEADEVLRLRAKGWIVTEILLRDEQVQASWARENGVVVDRDGVSDLEQVLVAQLERLRPEVLVVDDVATLGFEVIHAARGFVGCLVARVSDATAAALPARLYDGVIVSSRGLAATLAAAGETVILEGPEGDESSRAKDSAGARSPSPWRERQVDVAHVGALSVNSRARIALLEELARTTALQLWGGGAESLPARSILRTRYRGDVDASEADARRREAKIIVERQAGDGRLGDDGVSDDGVGDDEASTRVVAAMRAGALLVIDYRDALRDRFAIGRELVAYRSADECAALVQYHLDHPDEAEAIARAGWLRVAEDPRASSSGHGFVAALDAVLASRRSSPRSFRHPLDTHQTRTALGRRGGSP